MTIAQLHRINAQVGGTSRILDIQERLVQHADGSYARVTGNEASNTPEQISVSATTSTVLTTADAGRIRFVIYNPTAAVLYCRKAAEAASETNFDFVIPAGQSYFSDPYEWAGEIRCYSVPGGTINFSQSA